MDIRGLIFDCDGTLADTMPVHFEAWLATIGRYGLEMSEDRFYELGGWPTVKVAELLVRQSGSLHSPAAIAAEKERLYEAMLERVRPIEPVVAVVRQQRGKLPMAVATGATREVCRRTLTHIGLAEAFDTVVSCDQVTRHKPDPEVFLEAARRLGLAPERCRVYEDTDPGLEAARRAGMSWVDVRAWHTPRRVTPRDADAAGSGPR